MDHSGRSLDMVADIDVKRPCEAIECQRRILGGAGARGKRGATVQSGEGPFRVQGTGIPPLVARFQHDVKDTFIILAGEVDT